MAELQKHVQEIIDAQVAADRETAVQVAVYRHGELVVDAVAGPAESGTLFYTWSMGKAMTSTVVHRLVERGRFGYDTPVASLWPEFGARGKEPVTVRHVLQHTAGLPGIGAHTTVSDICDWDLICARIAADELWWEPGTQTGYHAYTFGWILGELARRATGTPIGELLRTEVAEPIGVAGELYFGMPEAEHSRLAPMVDGPAMPTDMPADSPLARSASTALWPTAALGNRTDVLCADIPAGGKMSARAIARMYAALVGEVDGVRLLQPSTVQAIVRDTFTGVDAVFGNEATWGLGFALGRLGGAPEDGTFGMGGAGGSFGYVDPAAGLAVAYVKNRQNMDFDTAEEVVNPVEAHFGSPAR